jgi:hypothetical protein
VPLPYILGERVCNLYFNKLLGRILPHKFFSSNDKKNFT